MTQRSRTRETKQRRVVYEAVRTTRSHPTADWIFEQVRGDMPKISLGTVYRNLAVLKGEGLVREIYGSDRKARFEANLGPHAHFVCSVCNEIRDVQGRTDIDWRGHKELVGCEVSEQRVEFVGMCPACQRRKDSRARDLQA